MIRAASPVLILLVAALSGCANAEQEGGDEAPPDGLVRGSDAVLFCIEGICNFEATLEPTTRQANELSIAVNPINPLNLLATGKDYTPDHAGDCVWDGIYVTMDGGLTWLNSNLPGSNWYAAKYPDQAQPHEEFSKFWCATDPVVAFASDGTAYWTVMPYQCDRFTGSKTGEGVHPSGGFNDWAWSCSSMYVLVSEDGGLTWPIVREVAFGARLEHDKQWITVAPNGNVLLCWDRSDNVDDDGTAVAQLRPQGDMVCSVSSDKGRTWTEWQSVNPDWPGFLPWIDYDGDSVAWMAALDIANVVVTSSADGVMWSAPTTVGSYVNPPPGGQYGWPVLNGSDFRTFALPSLAVDRSDGPYSGSKYVVWMDYANGRGQVMFTYSRDGVNWSQPEVLRDDGPNPGHDQFMPVVGVGPDGTVDVAWYDRRDDPDNHLFDLYYAASYDGGMSFGKNLRVSEVSSDEQYSHHQNGMIFLGDYIDIDSSPGKAHVVWVDTRNQQADVFVAHVARDSANDIP